MKANVNGRWFTVEKFLKDTVLVSNNAGETEIPYLAITETITESQFKKNSQRFLKDVIKKSWLTVKLLEYKPQNSGVN